MVARKGWARIIEQCPVGSSIGYDELVKRLADMGIEETVGSVTAKVN
jgi:hypothetical protein